MKHLLLSLTLILSANAWAKAEMCVNYLWEKFEKSCPQSNVKFIRIWDKPKPSTISGVKIIVFNKSIDTGKYMSMNQAGFSSERIESLTKELEDVYQCPKVSIVPGYMDVSYSNTALPTSSLKYFVDNGYTSGKEYFFSDCGMMLNGDMYFPKWGIDKHYD